MGAHTVERRLLPLIVLGVAVVVGQLLYTWGHALAWDVFESPMVLDRVLSIVATGLVVVASVLFVRGAVLARWPGLALERRSEMYRHAFFAAIVAELVFTVATYEGPRTGLISCFGPDRRIGLPCRFWFGGAWELARPWAAGVNAVIGYAVALGLALVADPGTRDDGHCPACDYPRAPDVGSRCAECGHRWSQESSEVD